MKEKREYWQSIRGVCILAVVLIHSLGEFDYSTGYNSAFIILRQIINFAVATFPFIIWSLLYSGLELLKTVHSGNEIHWLGVIL